MREASDAASRQGSTLLSRYYEDHPELVPGSAGQAMNDFNVIRVAVNAEVEGRVRPVLEHYEQQLAGQQRMVARLRVLSPAILMQDAVNDISGTGSSRHQHFMDQVSQYHARWRAYFVPLIFRKALVERYDTLPAFSFTEENFGIAARRIGASIVLLVGAATLLALIGFLRLRRFPLV